MTTPRHYEPKVRIALALLLVVLIGGPAIALRNCAANLSDRPVALAHPVDDDRVVKLRNGATILLDQGAQTPKIVDWLKLDTDKSTAFGIADSNFAGGSADPTATGSRAIGQVAQILKVDPELNAELFVARDSIENDEIYALEGARAARIAAELLRQGVSPDRIKSNTRSGSAIDADFTLDHPGQGSRLFIVLSR